MDLPKIARLMESSGFKNVNVSSEYDEILFHIVGETKTGFRKLTVVVRVVEVLDEHAAKRVAEEFIQLHNRKSSYLFGERFLYCLVAERKEEDSWKSLAAAIHSSIRDLKEGGDLLITEAATGWICAMNNVTGGEMTSAEGKMIDVLAQAGLARPFPMFPIPAPFFGLRNRTKGKER